MGEARNILLAGGTSRLGAVLAERLVRSGDRVLVFGRDAEKGSALAARIGVRFVAGAVDAGGLELLSNDVRETITSLDALVVFIGARLVARLSETSDDDWDSVIDANLVAPFMVARASLSLLRDGGTIVFIGSGTALYPDMELGAYSVAKRALERMAHMLAMETALRDIRVNVVNPGQMPEPPHTLGEQSGREVGPTPTPPLGRGAEPEDVAAAVEFLISEASAFCTGTSVTVDGGLRSALRAHRVRQ